MFNIYKAGWSPPPKSKKKKKKKNIYNTKVNNMETSVVRQ